MGDRSSTTDLPAGYENPVGFGIPGYHCENNKDIEGCQEETLIPTAPTYQETNFEYIGPQVLLACCAALFLSACYQAFHITDPDQKRANVVVLLVALAAFIGTYALSYPTN